MGTYIDDGWTRDDGYVAAASIGGNGDRLYDAVEFTYRPATRRELVRLDAEVTVALKNEFSDPEASVRGEDLVCKFMAKKVVSWSLKDRNGNAVIVSEESFGRINPAVFTKMYLIVRGSQLSDKKPEAEKQPLPVEELVGN